MYISCHLLCVCCSRFCLFNHSVLSHFKPVDPAAVALGSTLQIAPQVPLLLRSLRCSTSIQEPSALFWPPASTVPLDSMEPDLGSVAGSEKLEDEIEEVVAESVATESIDDIRISDIKTALQGAAENSHPALLKTALLRAKGQFSRAVEILASPTAELKIQVTYHIHIFPKNLSLSLRY